MKRCKSMITLLLSYFEGSPCLRLVPTREHRKVLKAYVKMLKGSPNGANMATVRLYLNRAPTRE